MDKCQRIGHGGASAIAPANTLASFDAARAVGVDMIEFDVRERRGELVLAHTVLDAYVGRSIPLRDALNHLAGVEFHGIDLNVDLKHVGTERLLLDELRRAELLDRTLISSQVTAVLDRVRALEPRARVGISVGGKLPRFCHRWGDWRALVLAGLAARRWDALMAQHRLIDAGLLEAVCARGGRLYAWTVNDRSGIESLRGLGVHGITTADPRLFAPG
ncbi:MAG TPA: glycerophosphodiester phosphodiesterase [Solirubrobacteraceae bacterium]|nr:glycerophosphodiester phosphodiesterase [Solirubrobacteraceae bacterium]